MLKFIVFIVLFSYVIFKGLGLLFRLLMGSPGSMRQQSHNYPPHGDRKPKDGNVNIDYTPNKGKKSSKGFKGGEYIDYEEVN